MPQGLERFALAQAAKALHFFARTKKRSKDELLRTCPKKFAVCTFCATSALFSAKQKELASLKQLFVFNAPHTYLRFTPKK